MSLTCPFCKSVLKNPVSMPCCKVILCRACAFKGLTRNGKKCWFTPCDRLKISYDELKICQKTNKLLLKEKEVSSSEPKQSNVKHKGSVYTGGPLDTEQEVTLTNLVTSNKSEEISSRSDVSVNHSLVNKSQDTVTKSVPLNKSEDTSIIPGVSANHSLVNKTQDSVTKFVPTKNVDESSSRSDVSANHSLVNKSGKSEEKSSQDVKETEIVNHKECLENVSNADVNDNHSSACDITSQQNRSSQVSTTAVNDQNVQNSESNKFSCPKCGRPCRNISFLKNHLVAHYYPTFYKVLPDSKPFSCPECGKIHRDRTSLARHFALVHKKIFELTDMSPGDFPFSDSPTKTCAEPKQSTEIAGSKSEKTYLDPEHQKVDDIISKKLDGMSKVVDVERCIDDIISKKLEEMAKVVEPCKRSSQDSSQKKCIPPSEKVPEEQNISRLALQEETLNVIPDPKENIYNLESGSTGACDSPDFNDSDWEIIDEWNDKDDMSDGEIGVENIVKEGANDVSIKSLETNRSNQNLLSSLVSEIVNEHNLTTAAISDAGNLKSDETSKSASSKPNTVSNEVQSTGIQLKRNSEITDGLIVPKLNTNSVLTSDLEFCKSPPPGESAQKVSNPKFERQDSSFLPSGLYGLLFLEVEALLDGDTKSLQITQFGCQTYFSNGELWSNFFAAIFPSAMADYMNHINPNLCTKLLSMLRMTFSHFNYQLVRPDSTTVECTSQDQAILKFAEYVNSVSELVDGMVFVINRPSLVLPLIQSLQFNPSDTVVGMIYLADLFSDSFPHSSSPDDIPSIFKLIFDEKSLSSKIDCDEKSQFLYEMTEKLLTKVDYESFVQPYGKLLPEIPVENNIDFVGGELRLIGSFSPEIVSITIHEQIPIHLKSEIHKNTDMIEENHGDQGLNVEKFTDFADLKLESSEKEMNQKQVLNKKEEEIESILNSSTEYVELEHDWEKFHKMKKDHAFQNSKVESFVSLNPELPVDVDREAGKLQTPEPRGQIDNYFDTEDEYEYDGNSDSDFGKSPSKRLFMPQVSQLRISRDLTYTDDLDKTCGEDVIVPTGPVCLCDQFTPPDTLQKISGNLEDLCKECRSCQVKIICLLDDSSRVKTLLAKIEDGDGIVANQCVKFLPSPFLIQLEKSVPFSQVRKVFLDNYILLCIEGNQAMELEKDSLIGLCQVWLGTKVEDLHLHDDIKLICESIHVNDDGSFVLLCSTELVLKRPLPLMVSNLSQYLSIKPQNRIVTANNNGMVSVTCRSGTTGYSPNIGDDVGTITTDVDEDLIDQIIKFASIPKPTPPPAPLKRKAISLNAEPQIKKLKVTTPTKSKDSALATLLSIKAKNALVTKSPLKFGIKKAFKASPLIRADAFTSQENDSSDDSSRSPSPPPLASVKPTRGSIPTKKQPESKNVVGISALASSAKVKTLQAQTVLPATNNPSKVILSCPTGQQIPTVVNRQTTYGHKSNPKPSLPIATTSIPTPICLPSIFPTYTPGVPVLSPTSWYSSSSCSMSPQFSLPKISPVALPKPSPAACKKCVFPTFQAMKLEACSSCPSFHLVLTSDMTLPPDKPTFGKVKMEGGTLDHGSDVQIFAKVYTSDNGILLMPQSLNLLPSDNPNPIPKQFVDGIVTVTFLSTVQHPIPLRAGQTVGRGQILYIQEVMKS